MLRKINEKLFDRVIYLVVGIRIVWHFSPLPQELPSFDVEYNNFIKVTFPLYTTCRVIKLNKYTELTSLVNERIYIFGIKFANHYQCSYVWTSTGQLFSRLM